MARRPEQPPTLQARRGRRPPLATGALCWYLAVLGGSAGVRASPSNRLGLSASGSSLGPDTAAATTTQTATVTVGLQTLSVTETIMLGANATALGGTAMPAATGSSTGAAIVPVPSGYTLPTAFDSILGVNFTSSSCPSFILTTLADPTFIQCTSFALLLSTSSKFFVAERSPNSLLPFVLDASCAAPDALCSAYFSTVAAKIQLQGTCGADLQAKNALASQALVGARNYSIMRAVGCLKDLVTGQYCFAQALEAPSPSSSYFYQLPSGISLPSGTTPQCSTCTAATMSIYSQYARNATLLISNTYAPAQSLTSAVCGPQFAPLVVTPTVLSSSPSHSKSLATVLLAPLLVALLA